MHGTCARIKTEGRPACPVDRHHKTIRPSEQRTKQIAGRTLIASFDSAQSAKSAYTRNVHYSATGVSEAAQIMCAQISKHVVADASISVFDSHANICTWHLLVPKSRQRLLRHFLVLGAPNHKKSTQALLPDANASNDRKVPQHTAAKTSESSQSESDSVRSLHK